MPNWDRSNGSSSSFLGNPEYGVDLQPIDHVAFARACGARGFRIEERSHCKAVLEEALSAPGPAIVEAVVDHKEPPLPPRVTPDEALQFAEALIRGEPSREKIALTAVGEKVRELI